MFDTGRTAFDIYQVLRSFNYEVKLFNNDGNSVPEPKDARRFFTLPKRLLVSLVDDGENSSIRLSNGNILVAGGSSTGGGNATLNSSEEYDTNRNEWFNTKTFTSARIFTGLIGLDNKKALLFGGASAGTAINTCFIY